MLACPSCGATYVQQLEHCGLDGHRLVDAPVPPLVGRTIDRYRVEEAIGSGGMSMVYRAVHVHLEQPFALKALHGEMASDATIAKRFEREAKVMSQLQHPNIVSVVDFGRTDGGLLYTVMEFVRGPTLSDVMRRSGALPPPRVAFLARQIATGLDRAHRSGFVHRDLKPQNVMLVGGDEEDEHAKILDFGLVGLVEPDASSHTQLTTKGMFFGTPAYMSPEQISGEPVGPESDLYALGVIMYAMLTGELPFRGTVRELAHQHVTRPAPRPPLDYGGLTDIVMSLLHKDPAARPRRGREVVERLDATGLTGAAIPSLLPSAEPSPTGSIDLSPAADFAEESGLADTRQRPAPYGAEPELVVSDAFDLTHPEGSFAPSTLRRRRGLGTMLVLAAGLVAVGALAATGRLDTFTRPLLQPGGDAPTPTSPVAGPEASGAAEPAPKVQAPAPQPEERPRSPSAEKSEAKPAPEADEKAQPKPSPRKPPTPERAAPQRTPTPEPAPKPTRAPVVEPNVKAPGVSPPLKTPDARPKDSLPTKPSPEPEAPPTPDPKPSPAPSAEPEPAPSGEPEPDPELERRLDESLKRLETSSTAAP